jgi:hypothetical protein
MFQHNVKPSAVMGLSLTSVNRRYESFTYNDSPYVHALNRALQLEQAAMYLFNARLRAGEDCNSIVAFHHYAYRQLVRLIFAQRGLPDSGPATFTAVTTTLAARVGKWMPEGVQHSLFDLSAARLTQSLISRYESLLEIAPPADVEAIEELLQQTRDFSLVS